MIDATLRILITCFVVVAFSSATYAQNNAQHSLYMIDIYNHNVAYAGFDRSLSANFNYRSQWSGLNGQPSSFYINAHLPVYLLNGGAGLSLARDKSGGLVMTDTRLSYNRVRSFSRGIFSVGAAIGLSQVAVDGSGIITPEGIYTSVISHEDPILITENMTGMHPGWMVSFYTANDLFDFGLSFRDMFGNALNVEKINFFQSRQMDIYGAIPFFVRDLKIQASFHIKSTFKQSQADMSIIIKNGNIFGGLTVRGFNENTFDSMVVLGGIRLNEHYTLSYSYDIGLSRLSDFNQGSHEININYNLNKLIGIGLPPEIIYNPRNL